MKMRLLVCLISGVLILASCSKKTEPDSSTQSSPPLTTTPVQPPATATATNPPKPERPAESKPAPPATAEVRHTPPPPPQPIVVPAGTVLTVRLQGGVSSKANHPGDRFEANLAEPLVVKGKTVAPTGSSAAGTVTNAKAAGRFKGAASLNLVLDTIVVHGNRYKIQTMAMSQTSKGKGKRTATMIGGGAGAGALIGGLTGGGKGAAIGALVGSGAGTAGAAFTGNKNDINLPAEAAVSFQLTAPLTLKPASPGSQAAEDSARQALPAPPGNNQ
jgi:hypothetical protein